MTKPTPRSHIRWRGVNVIRLTAVLIGKGYIEFYNLNNSKTSDGVWICDECYKPVRRLKRGDELLEKHIKLDHGWKA